MKWKVGCNLNTTEDRTVVTYVGIKLGKVKVKLPLCTIWKEYEAITFSLQLQTLRVSKKELHTLVLEYLIACPTVS